MEDEEKDLGDAFEKKIVEDEEKDLGDVFEKNILCSVLSV